MYLRFCCSKPYYQPDTTSEYRQYVFDKTERLCADFLLVVVIVLLRGLVLQQFAFVDSPISGWDDSLKPLIMPQQSSVRFVWYVYVLFLLYAQLLVVFLITRGNLLLSIKATVSIDCLDSNAAARERVLVSLRTVSSFGGLDGQVLAAPPIDHSTTRSWLVCHLLCVASTMRIRPS